MTHYSTKITLWAGLVLTGVIWRQVMVGTLRDTTIPATRLQELLAKVGR